MRSPYIYSRTAYQTEPGVFALKEILFIEVHEAGPRGCERGRRFRRQARGSKVEIDFPLY